MRSKHGLLTAALLSLAACGGEGDSAPDNAVRATANTGRVLPIEDNATKPAIDATVSEQTMPAVLHGRWGLTEADCAAATRNANGRVTVTADEIRFYESVAKPDNVRSRSETAIEGEFAFTGEGMSWSVPMSWSVAGDKLTRIDSEPQSRLVYTRC